MSLTLFELKWSQSPIYVIYLPQKFIQNNVWKQSCWKYCQAPGPVQCPGQGPVSSPWSRSRSELLNSKFSVKFSKERTWRDTIIKQATTISPAVPLHISGCATHHQTFLSSNLRRFDSFSVKLSKERTWRDTIINFVMVFSIIITTRLTAENIVLWERYG